MPVKKPKKKTPAVDKKLTQKPVKKSTAKPVKQQVITNQALVQNLAKALLANASG